MAKKPATLTDEQILAKVSLKSTNSVSWFDSRLARERIERVHPLSYLNGDAIEAHLRGLILIRFIRRLRFCGDAALSAA